jgi:hypothetical protein
VQFGVFCFDEDPTLIRVCWIQQRQIDLEILARRGRRRERFPRFVHSSQTLRPDGDEIRRSVADIAEELAVRQAVTL